MRKYATIHFGITWRVLFGALVLTAPWAVGAAPISITTVPVGNVSNADDPLTGNQYGGVDHAYRIATTEVTNDQYVAFLNEKAKSDPLELYSTSMASEPRGGIIRSGASGSYTYAPKPNMGDKPVNYVSWYDAIRFANWLNNGQGNADTETGAYSILGGTPEPSNGDSITRNAGATWFLTSEDEWYKAAYHQPTAQGGDVDNYWLYPTATNAIPTVATADAVGNISNPGPNVVNYNKGADWNGLDGNVTTVGSAGPLSASFYGTFDQGGNVDEWNESLAKAGYRGVRGGSWDRNEATVVAPGISSDGATHEHSNIGFRVAMVPEPSALALAGIGALGFVVRLFRRRATN